MTVVNRGPAISNSPNTQATLGSTAIVNVTLGAGPYDLARETLPGYKSGGTGVIKVVTASPSTTINTLSANDAAQGSELTWINLGPGNLLFNNLGGVGATAAFGFQNMNAGQVVIYPGGAGTCMRINQTATAQGYWQFQ